MPDANDPSAWPRRILIAVLAAAGLAISAYLAAYQLGAIPDVWEPLFGAGSREVLRSSVSLRIRSLTGVPDSLFGVLAYATEIVLALAGPRGRFRSHPMVVTLFGLDVLPLGAGSLVLVLLQAFVIRSFCTLCLTSAAASLLIVLLAHREVMAAIRQLRA